MAKSTYGSAKIFSTIPGIVCPVCDTEIRPNVEHSCSKLKDNPAEVQESVEANPALTYFCDVERHLVCLPYSVPNLHRMAAALGIKRCWFHRDHYDVPKGRIEEIKAKCVQVNPRKILQIIGRI